MPPFSRSEEHEHLDLVCSWSLALPGSMTLMAGQVGICWECVWLRKFRGEGDFRLEMFGK